MFFQTCTQQNIDLPTKGFVMSYKTNIPRMVSLVHSRESVMSDCVCVGACAGRAEWFFGDHCRLLHGFAEILWTNHYFVGH
jgi:hypothetical protein